MINNRLLICFVLVVSFCNLRVVKGQTATPDNFFVFVGEKISLSYVTPDSGEIPFDSHFSAKYKIDTSIYGNFSGDTIEFDVYIHLGDSPAFSTYKNVLLYLTKYNGKWYHEKYQFNAVYRTIDGRWAGTGKSDDYGHSYNKNTRLKPEKITFADHVKFDLNKYDSMSRSYWFENQYYLIKDNVAFPIEGNYIEDLFTLKKTGVLKARGLF